MWGQMWGKRAELEKPAFTAAPTASSSGRSSDFLVAFLGIALGLTCALFPWYIFFNQEQFGIKAMQFSGEGEGNPRPATLADQADRMGAPMDALPIPIEQLDLFATGTLPPKSGEGNLAVPGIELQPFPAEEAIFKLVHVANGRAMIEDDSGLWVVQRGSQLPDNSRVSAIEQRDGKWVLVTSADRVINLEQ